MGMSDERKEVLETKLRWILGDIDEDLLEAVIDEANICFEEGHKKGYDSGYEDGNEYGYEYGYEEGYEYGYGDTLNSNE